MKRAHPTILKPGFTLLEVVLVLAIVMVMGAIAAPRYAGANARYRADFAVQRIAADLDLAKHFSRTAGQSVKMAFDISTNSYQISGINALDGSGTYRLSLEKPPYQATLIKVAFGSDNLTTLQFDGWGVPMHSGSVIITVGSEERTLTLNSVSGEVAIE